MSATCPAGHVTESTDYCDTCGLPVDATPGGAATSGASLGAGAAISSAPPSAPQSAPPGTATGAGGAASGPASGPVGAGALAGHAAPGAPVPAAPGVGAPEAPAAQTCPNCQTVNPADALFCEACGYDFTTGAMPGADQPGPDAVAEGAPLDAGQAVPAGTEASPGASAGSQPDGIPLEWVAEVWVDPGWAALQESDDPVPSPGPPAVVPLHGRSLLVGRPSSSRNIHPDLDLTGDPGVSRRQAQLTTDGRRWWVEDLQSSNGTFVAASSAPFPTEPIEPGQRRELGEDDRIYLGAWTRLVLRRATPQEAGA